MGAQYLCQLNERKTHTHQTTMRVKIVLIDLCLDFGEFIESNEFHHNNYYFVFVRWNGMMISIEIFSGILRPFSTNLVNIPNSFNLYRNFACAKKKDRRSDSINSTGFQHQQYSIGTIVLCIFFFFFCFFLAFMVFCKLLLNAWFVWSSTLNVCINRFVRTVATQP